MGITLLESKLHIPVRPREIVPRVHLRNTLKDRITHFRLVLVSAPAGYGKTTLLAEWARTSSLPVAWLSITKEEDEVERFLRYLFAAWEGVQPDIVETPLGILLGSNSPDIKAVLSAFLNAASQLQGHLAFVLDDYHILEDTGIHDAVTFILDHLPSKLHFILASRSEPPLPLSRYRARGQLLELRADDLRFKPEESADFLSQLTGLDLSPDEVSSLHHGTEGWIAGLQLAALTLRDRQIGTEGNPLVSGRQRFIADYLAEDVLDPLPTGIQDFLLKTSLLNCLCGSLCDTVTGKEGGQDVLEMLERENIFLVALDDRREWFRYHELFADFLHEELKRRHPTEIADLHRRASRWYLDRDLPELAFRHAVDGDEVELVMQIFERYFHLKLFGGEIRVVKGWLELAPEGVV